MKKLVILLALTACEQSKSPDAPTTTTASVAPVASAPPVTTMTASAPPATTLASPEAAGTATDAPRPKRPLAKEGEMCSGIAAIQCADGLTCKKVGKPYPDQSGTCQK